MVKILGGVGVPFFLCVRFCCLDLVGYPLQLLVLKFFLIQCLYLPLSGLVVCLGINGGCGWAGVSCLVLDEPEVLLDVVQPCQVSVPEHMRMQFPDTGLSAKLLDLLIDAAIDHPFTVRTCEQRAFRFHVPFT